MSTSQPAWHGWPPNNIPNLNGIMVPTITSIASGIPLGTNHVTFHTLQAAIAELSVTLIKEVAVRINGSFGYSEDQFGEPIGYLRQSEWMAWFQSLIEMPIAPLQDFVFGEEAGAPCLCVLCSNLYCGEDMAGSQLEVMMHDPQFGATVLPAWIFNGQILLGGEALSTGELFRIARVCKQCVTNLSLAKNSHRTADFSVPISAVNAGPYIQPPAPASLPNYGQTVQMPRVTWTSTTGNPPPNNGWWTP